MLNIESDGRLRLMVWLPGATRVEVVGTFDGEHEERWEMSSDEGGRWWIELPPAARTSREFLFRYLIDGAYCVLDSGIGATRTSPAGYEMSRVLMPAA